MPFQFRKESIEENLNTNFPSQGQGNPPLYYSLSETVVPTYSINAVAEGSALPEILQTAWDFSTGGVAAANNTATAISNTGFWQVWGNIVAQTPTSAQASASIRISDGASNKSVWSWEELVGTTGVISQQIPTFYVFVRSGDSVTAQTNSVNVRIDLNYRQVADVNGNLVNPLGYSAA